MTTRTGKIEDIDKVARGRIFVAKQAKELGLVDEIGGLDEAITYAAKQATLDAGSYDVRVLPAAKTLGDLLMGNGTDAAMPFKPKIEIKTSSLLPAGVKLDKALGQELQMLQLLQQRPVVLVSPYRVTVK